MFQAGENPSYSAATAKMNITKSADMTNRMKKKGAFHTLILKTSLAVKAVSVELCRLCAPGPSEHIEAYKEDKDLIELRAQLGL